MKHASPENDQVFLASINLLIDATMQELEDGDFCANCYVHNFFDGLLMELHKNNKMDIAQIQEVLRLTLERIYGGDVSVAIVQSFNFNTETAH